MSKIKLTKYTEEFGNIGINPDVDENDKPFNRISLWVQDPITKENLRYEWNKTDSGIILTEESDGTYVETKDVEYYQKLWEANTYQEFLTLSTLIRPKETDTYNIENNMAVPKSTNTYDEVYVNKKLVRTDYNIGLWQSDELIEEVEKVFGKDQEWKCNRFNILGTYQEHDDAPLRPPYTNVKTYSWYNVFTDVPKETLNAFKVPDVGYTYKEWHAIKYNTVTGKKQFKLVIADTEHTSNYQKHPDVQVINTVKNLFWEAKKEKFISEEEINLAINNKFVSNKILI